MTKHLDRLLAEIAESQAGSFSREQALSVGFTRKQVAGRLASGQWAVLYPRVYCLAAVRTRRAAGACGALLYAGRLAIFSHLTAARLVGLDVPRNDLIWITVPHDVQRKKQPGIEITRTRNMPKPVTVNEVPITPLPRTIVDLAQVLDRRPLLATFHDAVNRKLVSVERVLAAAEGMGGRAGLALLRDVAAELDPIYESMLEIEAGRLFVAAGIELQRQVEIRHNGRLVVRVDFADPVRKLAIQVDGLRWHSSAVAQQRDRAQDRELNRLGWTVVRFTTEEIRKYPDRVIEEILEQIEIVDGAAA